MADHRHVAEKVVTIVMDVDRIAGRRKGAATFDRRAIEMKTVHLRSDATCGPAVGKP